MTVILNNRWDVNLDATFRVAWQREPVRISDTAMQRIATSRASFLEMIERDPSVIVYGVTTSMGEAASQRLTPEQRFRHARISELLQVHGVDPLTVAQQTGTSVEMIERSYLRFIPSALQLKLATLKT